MFNWDLNTSLFTLMNGVGVDELNFALICLYVMFFCVYMCITFFFPFSWINFELFSNMLHFHNS